MILANEQLNSSGKNTFMEGDGDAGKLILSLKTLYFSNPRDGDVGGFSMAARD